MILRRSESVFESNDSDCLAFPHISKIEDPPIGFGYFGRSQNQDVWNDPDIKQAFAHAHYDESV